MHRVSSSCLALALVTLFSCNSAPLSPAPGRAVLSTPRKQLPLVVLADGRALAAGGFDGHQALRSSELYDPETGAWSATGPLRVPRRNHAAVVLKSGQVLVVGGSSSHVQWGALPSAELYVPERGEWVPVEAMREARHDPAAVVLKDGRVLVAGGFDVDGRPVRSAEVFDPEQGRWLPTGAPGAVRSGGHTGVVLEDGRVLFASGLQAELYEPRTGQWSAAGPVGGAAGTHRTGHTVTRLEDGRVLVVGGTTSRASSTAEVYEPAKGRWQLVASPQVAREGHGAVLAEDGSVLVVGGAYLELGALAAVERYDPVRDTWRQEQPLQVARRGAGVAMLPGGELLVVGGSNELQGTLSASERYTCGQVEE